MSFLRYWNIFGLSRSNRHRERSGARCLYCEMRIRLGIFATDEEGFSQPTSRRFIEATIVRKRLYLRKHFRMSLMRGGQSSNRRLPEVPPDAVDLSVRQSA